MSSFNSLFPWSRDTLTETTTIRHRLTDSKGHNMDTEKRAVMNRK